MTAPLIIQDFQLAQGDAWPFIFPIVDPLTGLPFPLTGGYTSSFSVRQNYGDPTPLIFITNSSPTPNGSTIGIIVGPGSTVLNAIQVTVVGLDTMMTGAPPLTGNRQAKYYYNVRMISPQGFVTTVAAGTWYIQAQA